MRPLRSHRSQFQDAPPKKNVFREAPSTTIAVTDREDVVTEGHNSYGKKYFANDGFSEVWSAARPRECFNAREPTPRAHKRDAASDRLCADRNVHAAEVQSVHEHTDCATDEIQSRSWRHKMHPLQERLSANYRTVSTDWPGFGDQPRPCLDRRPETYGPDDVV